MALPLKRRLAFHKHVSLIAKFLNRAQMNEGDYGLEEAVWPSNDIRPVDDLELGTSLSTPSAGRILSGYEYILSKDRTSSNVVACFHPAIEVVRFCHPVCIITDGFSNFEPEQTLLQDILFGIAYSVWGWADSTKRRGQKVMISMNAIGIGFLAVLGNHSDRTSARRETRLMGFKIQQQVESDSQLRQLIREALDERHKDDGRSVYDNVLPRAHLILSFRVYIGGPKCCRFHSLLLVDLISLGRNETETQKDNKRSGQSGNDKTSFYPQRREIDLRQKEIVESRSRFLELFSAESEPKTWNTDCVSS